MPATMQYQCDVMMDSISYDDGHKMAEHCLVYQLSTKLLLPGYTWLATAYLLLASDNYKLKAHTCAAYAYSQYQPMTPTH